MGRLPVITITAIVLTFSCNSSDQAGPGPGDADTAPPRIVPADAGVAPVEAALPEPFASTRTRTSTPASEFHLDDSGSTYRPRPRRTPARAERPTIHITLKSTPSGALVAVDGVAVGRTPAFWEGEVTGKPHEFTFVLPGHAMARYRFVPTSHGIVHGTLKRLSTETSEAGEADVMPRP